MKNLYLALIGTESLFGARQSLFGADSFYFGAES